MRTADTEAAGPRTPGGPARWLVVIEPASSRVVPLPDAAEIVVGRGSEAALRLSDAKVSRTHARLLVNAERVMVEDLGSQNGTWVNGERIVEPRALGPGDVVELCGSTLVYHAPRPRRPAPAAGPILPADALRDALDAEIERATAKGRPLSLIALELGVPDAGATAAILAPQLAPGERAAPDGRERLIIVVPDADDRSAKLRAASLAASLAEHLAAPAASAAERGATERAAAAAPKTGVRAGVATHPADGCDADTLLASARAAAAAAAPPGVEVARRAHRIFRVGDHELLLADPAMLRLYDLIERIAQSDLPVLVQGETGAGKELAALAVHHFSPRRDQRVIALNCAALAETLVESELFGHERGAFTGAVANKIGLLEAASGGTVLLDEVGELSPATQAKLLRALDTGRVVRVGDTRERAVDVRIVAATNRDLAREVGAGRFRSDLYFRLGGVTLCVPPLRDRPREIALLAGRFLARACERLGRAPMKISDDALRALAAHPWPGNVRELVHALELCAAIHTGPILEARHLEEVLRSGPTASDAAIATASAPSARPLDDEVRDLEIARIREALESSEGNQRRAAELLGMPLRTLVSKLARYGLQKRRR